MGLVGGRELGINGASRPRAQQFELDRTYSAADLEHSPAVDPFVSHEVDETLRVAVEPTAPVPARVSPGNVVREELVAPSGRAAAGHVEASMRDLHHRI